MNLDDLKKMGGFVDTEPVKKSIEWTARDSEKLSGEVFVVRQQFGDIDRALSGKAADRSNSAILIHLCIRLGSDGNEQLTYEQAVNLYPPFAWALVNAINEVNYVKQ